MIRVLVRFAVPWRIAMLMSVAFVAMAAFMMRLMAAHPVVVLIGVAPCLLMPMALVPPNKRATLFEAGLPIAGRQIFLARVLVQTLVIWAPIVCVCLLGMASASASSALIVDFLGVGAIATVAILVPQSLRASDLTSSSGLTALIAVAIGAVGALAWYALPAPIALALFALAGAAAFVRAWSAVPASYQTAPMAPERPVERTRFGAAPRFALDLVRIPWLPMVRPAFSWVSLVFFVFWVACGLAGAGTMLFFGVVYFVPGAVVRFRQRAGWMSALPIAHRTLLLLTLIGSVAPAWCGMAVGFGLRRSIIWNTPGLWLNNGPFEFRDMKTFFGSKTSLTCVTLEFWRLAPDGRAPVIRSPAGETLAPPTMSILGVAVYNPYYAGPDSSDAFIDWQFERATTAMFGRPISRVAAHKGNQAQGPPLTEQPRMLILVGAVLLLLLLYPLFVFDLLAWHRLRRPEARTLYMCLLGLTGGPLVALLAADMWCQMAKHTNVFLPVVQHYLLRLSGVLPQSLLLLTAIVALPVLAMLWMMEKQFRSTESLSGPQASWMWRRAR